jgi:hypothetical protein
MRKAEMSKRMAGGFFYAAKGVHLAKLCAVR